MRMRARKSSAWLAALNASAVAEPSHLFHPGTEAPVVIPLEPAAKWSRRHVVRSEKHFRTSSFLQLTARAKSLSKGSSSTPTSRPTRSRLTSKAAAGRSDDEDVSDALDDVASEETGFDASEVFGEQPGPEVRIVKNSTHDSHSEDDDDSDEETDSSGGQDEVDEDEDSVTSSSSSSRHSDSHSGQEDPDAEHEFGLHSPHKRGAAGNPGWLYLQNQYDMEYIAAIQVGHSRRRNGDGNCETKADPGGATAASFSTKKPTATAVLEAEHEENEKEDHCFSLPQSRLRVILDTGSSDIWLNSEKCGIGLGECNRGAGVYSAEASVSARRCDATSGPPPEQGGEVEEDEAEVDATSSFAQNEMKPEPQAAEDSCAIASVFGSGILSGVRSFDDVKIGPVTVFGQGFNQIREHYGEVFEELGFDGIVGLGFPDLVATPSEAEEIQAEVEGAEGFGGGEVVFGSSSAIKNTAAEPERKKRRTTTLRRGREWFRGTLAKGMRLPPASTSIFQNTSSTEAGPSGIPEGIAYQSKPWFDNVLDAKVLPAPEFSFFFSRLTPSSPSASATTSGAASAAFAGGGMAASSSDGSVSAFTLGGIYAEAVEPGHKIEMFPVTHERYWAVELVDITLSNSLEEPDGERSVLFAYPRRERRIMYKTITLTTTPTMCGACAGGDQGDLAKVMEEIIGELFGGAGGSEAGAVRGVTKESAEEGEEGVDEEVFGDLLGGEDGAVEIEAQPEEVPPSATSGATSSKGASGKAPEAKAPSGNSQKESAASSNKRITKDKQQEKKQKTKAASKNRGGKGNKKSSATSSSSSTKKSAAGKGKHKVAKHKKRKGRKPSTSASKASRPAVEPEGKVVQQHRSTTPSSSSFANADEKNGGRGGKTHSKIAEAAAQMADHLVDIIFEVGEETESGSVSGHTRVAAKQESSKSNTHHQVEHAKTLLRQVLRKKLHAHGTGVARSEAQHLAAAAPTSFLQTAEGEGRRQLALPSLDRKASVERARDVVRRYRLSLQEAKRKAVGAASGGPTPSARSGSVHVVRRSKRVAKSDTVKNDTVKNDTMKNDTVENGTVENGTVENGTVENDTLKNTTDDGDNDTSTDEDEEEDAETESDGDSTTPSTDDDDEEEEDAESESSGAGAGADESVEADEAEAEGESSSATGDDADEQEEEDEDSSLTKIPTTVENLIVDSGTSLFTIPGHVYQELKRLLPDRLCHQVVDMPNEYADLVFHLRNREGEIRPLRLAKEDYMVARPAELSLTATGGSTSSSSSSSRSNKKKKRNEVDLRKGDVVDDMMAALTGGAGNSEMVCGLAFTPLDIPEFSVPGGAMVAGMAFMRKYYSVFNRGTGEHGPAVGFGLARSDLAAADPMPDAEEYVDVVEEPMASAAQMRKTAELSENGIVGSSEISASGVAPAEDGALSGAEVDGVVESEDDAAVGREGAATANEESADAENSSGEATEDGESDRGTQAGTTEAREEKQHTDVDVQQNHPEEDGKEQDADAAEDIDALIDAAVAEVEGQRTKKGKSKSDDEEDKDEIARKVRDRILHRHEKQGEDIDGTEASTDTESDDAGQAKQKLPVAFSPSTQPGGQLRRVHRGKTFHRSALLREPKNERRPAIERESPDAEAEQLDDEDGYAPEAAEDEEGPAEEHAVHTPPRRIRESRMVRREQYES